MGCTWMAPPARIMNERRKSRIINMSVSYEILGIPNKTKTKIQIKHVVKNKINSLCILIFSLHCILIVECPSNKTPKRWTFKTSKTIGTGRGKPEQL